MQNNIIKVAYIVEHNGYKTISNIAEFEASTFNDTKEQISTLNLLPDAELVPLSELPSGVWIGWCLSEQGEWFNPNPVVPEEVPEIQE